jgi:hypothetical protein
MVVACGGATLGGGPGSAEDGGVSRDGASPHDGRTADAARLGDGGCINPVVGEACTETSSACPEVGDPCCIGYVWECQGGAWERLGLGCACKIEPDSGVDAGTDCGQPTEPTYSCATAGDAATADGGVCHTYGVDAGASGPTYPFGCTVTLTTCNTSFGGAQTCNCESFPGNGPAPTWVCPL